MYRMHKGHIRFASRAMFVHKQNIVCDYYRIRSRGLPKVLMATNLAYCLEAAVYELFGSQMKRSVDFDAKPCQWKNETWCVFGGVTNRV